jgi:hypothetical protein
MSFKEFLENYDELLSENRVTIRVNSRGQRSKKLKCSKGLIVKKVNGQNVCVAPSGQQKANKKKSIIKSIRTKSSKGKGYANRINRKRKRAIRKRREMGL